MGGNKDKANTTSPHVLSEQERKWGGYQTIMLIHVVTSEHVLSSAQDAEFVMVFARDGAQPSLAS